MNTVKIKIFEFVEKYYNLKKDLDLKGKDYEGFIKFLYDQRNAALGDSLINFIYSCAKSIAKQEMTGLKIADTILLNGFLGSKLSSWLKLKGNKKDKANAIEALIFYTWLVYDFSIEEMTMNLLLNLGNNSFDSRFEEQRFVSTAFTTLFNSINLIISGNQK